MNSALMNVWREAGAHIRYADAKSLFLLGISAALLFSFLEFALISSAPEWRILRQLILADLSAASWISIASFSVSFVSASLAAIPNLSKSKRRVKLLNSFGRYFSRSIEAEENGGIIFFKSIARFSSSEDYLLNLTEKGVFSGSPNSADRELAEQVWVTSQIAYSKFVAVNISISALITGVFVAIFSL